MIKGMRQSEGPVANGRNPKALRFSDMMKSKTSRLIELQEEEAKKKEKLMFKKEKPEELARDILTLCNVTK